MAIKCKDTYYKLVNADIDYVNQKAFATFNRYDTEEHRLKEKELAATAATLCDKIITKVQDELAVLGEYVSTTYGVSVDDIVDGDAFLQEHPDVKARADDWNALQLEGMLIRDSLLRKNLDIETLKFKDIWLGLGLTQALCTNVSSNGSSGFLITDLTGYNIDDIYKQSKTVFSDEVIDC